VSAAVNDDPTGHVPAAYEGAWRALASGGYAVIDDQSIGLPEKFRENFRQAYFNEQVLRHDEGDWPIDRQRARDVIRYRWHGSDLQVQSHDTITITDRAGIPGRREHARVDLLADRAAEDLIRAVLKLVPADRRKSEGTLGVNLFRTFTNVVTKPHHDNEEFIILYVLDRSGDGATTYLYQPGDVAENGEILDSPVLDHQLNPGDMIIFEDSRYKHGATPLTNPPGGHAQRDVLVFTVDYPDTYLGPALSS
jgi:2OG-Fe dioxygenase